jgi:hypothetical protein
MFRWCSWIHIHSEDGSCSVCRKFGKPSTFDAAHPRTPELHIESLTSIHTFATNSQLSCTAIVVRMSSLSWTCIEFPSISWSFVFYEQTPYVTVCFPAVSVDGAVAAASLHVFILTAVATSAWSLVLLIALYCLFINTLSDYWWLKVLSSVSVVTCRGYKFRCCGSGKSTGRRRAWNMWDLRRWWRWIGSVDCGYSISEECKHLTTVTEINNYIVVLTVSFKL